MAGSTFFTCRQILNKIGHPELEIKFVGKPFYIILILLKYFFLLML
jgi:hypothetical protein